MHAQGVELEVSDEAVQYSANAGFDPQYGARPLRRAIQRLLEDELSERLLAGEIEPGQRVRVDLRDGRLTVDTVPEAEAGGNASETGARAWRTRRAGLRTRAATRVGPRPTAARCRRDSSEREAAARAQARSPATAGHPRAPRPGRPRWRGRGRDAPAETDEGATACA